VCDSKSIGDFPPLGYLFAKPVIYLQQARATQQGLERGQFVVARVEPELPPAEITENWFPTAAQKV